MDAQLLEELYNIWYKIESNINKDLKELECHINELYALYVDCNPDDPKNQDFKEFVEVNYYEDNLDLLQVKILDLIKRINMNISYKPERLTHYRETIKGILQEHFTKEEINYFFNYTPEE